jgi:hypothetical protein
VAGTALTITPAQPVAVDEDYPAQHPPVIDPRLAARLRKERPKPLHLRVRQPKEIALLAPSLWELESRRQLLINLIYGS